jgi:hypothetical protein
MLFVGAMASVHKFPAVKTGAARDNLAPVTDVVPSSFKG